LTNERREDCDTGFGGGVVCEGDIVKKCEGSADAPPRMRRLSTVLDCGSQAEVAARGKANAMFTLAPIGLGCRG
jgi:hypothetical protein